LILIIVIEISFRIVHVKFIRVIRRLAITMAMTIVVVLEVQLIVVISKSLLLLLLAPSKA
jgi:hypothetical protein